MFKQENEKIVENANEFNKLKKHAKQKQLAKKNCCKQKQYDYDSVDVNEIRKKVYESTAARDCVDAESFLAKK